MLNNIRVAKSETSNITELYLASRQKIDLLVDGNEETIQDANFSFSYNPIQKAGSLTFIYDGFAASRNELFINCNEEVLSK